MAAPTTSYEVFSGDETTLAVSITATQTSGISFAAIRENGSTRAFSTTTGVVQIEQEVDGTRYVEWMSFSGFDVNSDNSVTLTAANVGRGVSQSTTDLSASGTGQRFLKGAKVKLVTFHYLLNKKANIDRTNTFSAAQTIGNSVALQFGSSSAYIKSTDSGTNLTFADGSNAPVTLSQLAALSGEDRKVRVSVTDTTNGYLLGKLPAGNGITMTQGNVSGDETLTPAVSLASNPGLEFSSGSVRVKIYTAAADEGTSLTRDSNGLWTTCLDSSSYLFGWRTDGNVTLGVDTTLSADAHYDTLDLAGFTLNTAGYRVFANRITGSGKIKAKAGVNGSNGSGTTGGAAGTTNTGGTLPDSNASTAGGAGGAAVGAQNNANAGTASSTTSAVTNSLSSTNGATGGNGGNGGWGSGAGAKSGGTGGTAGTAGTTTNATLTKAHILHYALFATNKGATWTQIQQAAGATGGAGGASGGGGNSSGGAAGGGGGGAGSNGGYFYIAAAKIDGAWTIESTGGNGGNGAAGSNGSGDGGSGGGGGAGGGGSGGCGFLVYRDKASWTGSATLTAGTAGTLGAAGTGGANAGQAGSASSAGSAGVLVQIQVL